MAADITDIDILAIEQALEERADLDEEVSDADAVSREEAQVEEKPEQLFTAKGGKTLPEKAINRQEAIDKEFDINSDVFKTRQTAFFGRDRRSLEKRGLVAGLAFNARSQPEITSSRNSITSGSNSSMNSKGNNKSRNVLGVIKKGLNEKSPRKRRRMRRSSIQKFSDTAKRQVRRMSVREAALSGMRRKRRKRKPCFVLRSKIFYTFLTGIFGRRFEVKHKHMHVLALDLSGKQRSSAYWRALLAFFVLPLAYVSMMWAIPLASLSIDKETTGNASHYNVSTQIYFNDSVPLNSSEQGLYFWVTLPLVLLPLALIPAHWYHRTMDMPFSVSVAISLSGFLLSSLVVAHISASYRRMFNAMLAMGVGTCFSVLLMAVASIMLTLQRNAKGGFKAYRAAVLIQHAWHKGKGGHGLEKVQNWMAASGVDDHAIVMDEVPIFKGLKPEMVARIQMTMQPKEYSAGDYICREGEPGRLFFIILEGVVSVRMKATENIVDDVNETGTSEFSEEDAHSEETSEALETSNDNAIDNNDRAVESDLKKNDDDNDEPTLEEWEICRMRAGDFFGEVALLDKSKEHFRTASVVALTSNVKTFAISSHNFHRTLLPNLSDDARTHLMRVMERRLNHTAEIRLETSPMSQFVRRNTGASNISTSKLDKNTRAFHGHSSFELVRLDSSGFMSTDTLSPMSSKHSEQSPIKNDVLETMQSHTQSTSRKRATIAVVRRPAPLFGSKESLGSRNNAGDQDCESGRVERPRRRPEPLASRLTFLDIATAASNKGTPLNKVKVLRKRNSSLRQVVLAPDGHRRVTNGVEDINDSQKLRRQFASLKWNVVKRATNTGLSLLLSFLEYPVFLAYLFGFAKISQSAEYAETFGPLYVLLLGPLRFGWQALTEWGLSRADQYTARAGGAWSLAVGEFFRITMFGLTSDTTSLVFIVVIDMIRHGMLTALLNRHILITVYRGTSQRVRARVDIGECWCLCFLLMPNLRLLCLQFEPPAYSLLFPAPLFFLSCLQL